MRVPERAADVLDPLMGDPNKIIITSTSIRILSEPEQKREPTEGQAVRCHLLFICRGGRQGDSVDSDRGAEIYMLHRCGVRSQSLCSGAFLPVEI